MDLITEIIITSMILLVSFILIYNVSFWYGVLVIVLTMISLGIMNIMLSGTRFIDKNLSSDNVAYNDEVYQ